MLSGKCSYFTLFISCVLLSCTAFGMEEKKKKRRKPKPAATRVCSETNSGSDDGEQEASQSLCRLLSESVLNPQESVTVFIDCLNIRLLIHCLFALKDTERAKAMIRAFENKNQCKVAEIASSIAFSQDFFEHAHNLLEAIQAENRPKIDQMIFDGQGEPFLLSAIGNEAVYDEKLLAAEWLFEQGVTFLPHRLHALSTASILWFYQHQIKMPAHQDQLLRLPMIITAAMQSSYQSMETAIRQTQPLEIEIVGALLITIALGDHNLTEQLLKAYANLVSQAYQELLIIRAAAFGHIDILHLVIETFGASDYALQESLQFAASRGQLHMLRFLLKNYKKEVEKVIDCAFIRSVLTGHSAVAQYLSKKVDKETERHLDIKQAFKQALYFAATHRRWGFFCWVLDAALTYGIKLSKLRKHFTFLLSESDVSQWVKKHITVALIFLRDEFIEETRLYGTLFLLPKDVREIVLQKLTAF